MDITWYQDFLALAETGKFTAAASLRQCSQSTLSRRIQLLENHLATQLFDRRVTPIRLTPSGKALTPTASELVRLSQECEQSVRVLDHPLTFASLHTLACNFFPQWISQYSTLDEPLFTRIDTGHKSTENYYMSLVSGRSDFILFYRDIPWLTYARSAQLHELSRPQVARHPEPNRLKRTFEATVSEALKPMVSLGMGIACMPHNMIAPLVEEGRLVRLYPDMPSNHLEIILVRWLGNHDATADTFWKRLSSN